jgi:Universal stress protein family
MRTASCMALCPTRYGSRSLWEAKRMSSGPAHPGVLVGVDGSPSSRVAVRWAAHEATVRNVPLTPCTSYARPRSAHRPCLGPLFPFPPNCANGRKTKPQRSWPTRSSSSKTAPQKVLGPRSSLLILRRMPFRGGCWKAVEESVAQLGRIPIDGLTPGGVPPRSTSQVVLRSATFAQFRA